MDERSKSLHTIQQEDHWIRSNRATYGIRINRKLRNASIHGGNGLTPLFHPELGHALILSEGTVPEGYRNYARSEGLDPSSYFQTVKQQSALSLNQGIESSTGGFGSSWKLLWSFFTIRQN